MDVFLKSAAGVLITLVLCLVLAKQGKDTALLLVLAVCCMLVSAAVAYLEPVIGFFDKLNGIGQLDEQMITILLKAVGIGLLGEVTGLLCADSGNGALGRSIQLLAAAVILWLSIPLFEALIDLIEEVLNFL